MRTIARIAVAGGLGCLLAYADPYIRVNQVGYLPAHAKIAVALTNANLSGQTFFLERSADSASVFNAKVGADRGKYGSFAHVYELDFSAVAQPGQYRIKLGSAGSPVFRVGAGIHSDAVAKTLTFFKVQRCGDTQPLLHGACHLKPSVAVGGPKKGKLIDVAGGWHDAGDYLKLMGQISAAATFLLLAHYERPAAGGDASGNGRPDVLDEAVVALDWMLKMWSPADNTLYFQVSDPESDHTGWRMPEGDDRNKPTRKVYASKSGKGANLAGRMAAAFAIASAIWGDRNAYFYDPGRASAYRTAAAQLYAWGRKNGGIQQETFSAWETNWKDDMALGAAALHLATGDAPYLKQAKAYGSSLPTVWSFDSTAMNAAAHYLIARRDPSYKATALKKLAQELDFYASSSRANVFRESLDVMYWSSATAMSARALAGLWYEILSGNNKYRAMAQAQWDYVFGANPWGVCFINSVGSVWPHDPHHQVAEITGAELVGFWNEGAVETSDWNSYGLRLRQADEFKLFQSPWSLYHDDVEDYVTNEPTISANGVGFALMAYMSGN